MALGIVLSIISNLGTSPLSCPAYVLSLRLNPTVGEFTIMVNMLLLVIQIMLLRKRFRAKYLLQIPATLLLGCFIDFWMMIFGDIHPDSIVMRLSLIVLSSMVTALGVSLEVESRALILSAEMTVCALSIVTSKPFRRLKVTMDCLYVVIAASLSAALFSNPFGAFRFTTLADAVLSKSPGALIGLGTVILAILPGTMMRWSDILVARFFTAIKSL